jgi:glycosyltransferase involved in cell wall biosynthesis
MVPVSVVIITKNEAEVIASCINAVKLITDDIIVVDNDSTDGTPDIARKYECRVYQENWDGYGVNKNKGITYARYNWILSIDADEIAGLDLVAALHEVKLDDATIVYDIKFISYYGTKPIHFGSWGRDHHIRLFNRRMVKWSETPVHETLILSKSITVKIIKGHLHHYSVKDSGEFTHKADHYAQLSAGKYLANNKKPTFLKLHIAPLFHFIKNYIVFFGFLDGREGYMIAKMISRHTWLKYRLLKEQPLISPKETPKVKDNLEMEYSIES